MKPTTEEQIAKLRDAIQTEKENKAKAEEHADMFIALQGREAELKTELEQVQKDIVAAMSVTFDVSDDMSIAAAEETLAKLEGEHDCHLTPYGENGCDHPSHEQKDENI